MAIITEVSPQRGSVRVTLDEGESFWLSGADALEGGFTAGMEVKREDFDQFILRHQYPRALNRAVGMLARRACASGEIRAKLLEAHYTEQVADLVLLKLAKERLLDDEAFCDQWVRYRGQKYGGRRIYQELRHKGIPEAMARAAVERMDGEAAEESALAQARGAWKRIGGQNPEKDWKARQKVIAALVRRGFDWDTARQAAEAALREEEEGSF